MKKRKNILHRISKDRIEKTLDEMGLHLVRKLNVAVTENKIHLYDNDGYYYTAYWGALSKGIHPLKYYNSNPYSIQNINHFLKVERNNCYECISTEYTGNEAPLMFKCNTCNGVFESNLIAIQGKTIGNTKEKYYKQCPYCNNQRSESWHASVLKQIFKHEYPDTIEEDRSCYNPRTGRCLPTDIVNHRLKIAVEIQSRYHDNKKLIDKFKKDYWLSRNYSFYDPDIRNYTVIEMVQLFFPNLQVVPEYVDLHYSDVLSNHIVQEELNKGQTVKEVASILNVEVYTIHNMIKNGTVYLPCSSKRKAIRIKSIVQLSIEGEYIRRFDQLADVEKVGYALGTIQRVLAKKQDFAYDSYWVYSNDYYNNRYEIPKLSLDRNLIRLFRIDKNGNQYYFNNVYEAANSISAYPYEVYDILIGKRKHIKGYSFKKYELNQ